MERGVISLTVTELQVAQAYVHASPTATDSLTVKLSPQFFNDPEAVETIELSAHEVETILDSLPAPEPEVEDPALTQLRQKLVQFLQQIR